MLLVWIPSPSSMRDFIVLMVKNGYFYLKLVRKGKVPWEVSANCEQKLNQYGRFQIGVFKFLKSNSNPFPSIIIPRLIA